MIRKGLKSFFPIIVLMLSLIQMGAIRRDQDPVLKAQTDPISLKQKLEETKDGVKGAPSPSFKYYDREDFLTRTPMEAAGEEKVVKSNLENAVEPVDEAEFLEIGNVPEDAPEKQITEAESTEDDWWLEDSAQENSEK